MKLKIGKSSFYNPEGLTVVPKVLREHYGINEKNYKKFELNWFFENNKLVVRIEKIGGE